MQEHSIKVSELSTLQSVLYKLFAAIVRCQRSFSFCLLLFGGSCVVCLWLSFVVVLAAVAIVVVLSSFIGRLNSFKNGQIVKCSSMQAVSLRARLLRPVEL